MRLNSYADVESLYNSIEPLGGKRASQDIRPLGKRTKWWDRVVKNQGDSYALHDGRSFWDTGAITWSRRGDRDYIKIRTGSYAASRYKFLQKYLPSSLNYNYNKRGDHWIEHNGVKYYLGSDDKVGASSTVYTPHRKNEIEFIAENGGFRLVSNPYKRAVKVLNKDLTKKYDKHIRKLWEWAAAVLPVFGDTFNDALFNTEHMYLLNLSNPQHVTTYDLKNWILAAKHTHVRQALLSQANPDFAEARLSLAMLAAHTSYTARPIYCPRNVNGVAVLDEIAGVANFSYTVNYDFSHASFLKFRKQIREAGDMYTVVYKD